MKKFIFILLVVLGAQQTHASSAPQALIDALLATSSWTRSIDIYKFMSQMDNFVTYGARQMTEVDYQEFITVVSKMDKDEKSAHLLSTFLNVGNFSTYIEVIAKNTDESANMLNALITMRSISRDIVPATEQSMVRLFNEHIKAVGPEKISGKFFELGLVAAKEGFKNEAEQAAVINVLARALAVNSDLYINVVMRPYVVSGTFKDILFIVGAEARKLVNDAADAGDLL